MMPDHSHQFVEIYEGLVGYGLDRATDEACLRVYLQKFSDDAMMEKILPRLDQEEMDSLFDTISALLKRHLSEDEYHQVFLKDGTHGEGPA